MNHELAVPSVVANQRVQQVREVGLYAEIGEACLQQGRNRGLFQPGKIVFACILSSADVDTCPRRL